MVAATTNRSVVSFDATQLVRCDIHGRRLACRLGKPFRSNWKVTCNKQYVLTTVSNNDKRSKLLPSRNQGIRDIAHQRFAVPPPILNLHRLSSSPKDIVMIHAHNILNRALAVLNHELG